MNKQKNILVNDTFVKWEMWQDAFTWDTESHAMKIYHKATREHFFLDGRSKMRNHLANETLNSSMLKLMEVSYEIAPLANLITIV